MWTIRLLHTLFLIVLVNTYFTISSTILEDENGINSEGVWKIHSKHYGSAASANGNSRFDAGSIITAIGLKKGASLLGLVVFPFLFPVVILFAGALFVISIFGGSAVAGRRFDLSSSSSSRNGVLAQILGNLQQFDLVGDVLEREECLERIGCEILDRTSGRGSKDLAKTKILNALLKYSRLLRKFNIAPNSLEKVDIAVRNGSSCSLFKCSLQDQFTRTGNIMPNI